jgi:hypothetical protein
LRLLPRRLLKLVDVDEAWRDFAAENPFKFQGKADIDGAHTKYFFNRQDGDKWLFKPDSEDFRVMG